MQSVQDFATEHGITVADWHTHGFHLDEDGREHQRWTFELARDEHTLQVPYRTGTGITDVPDVAEILNSLATDAQAGEEDFEEFCADFGYDTDSRKAYATWEACREMRDRLGNFLGAGRYEELLYDTEKL